MASKNVVEIILSAKDEASKIVKEVFREFQDSASTSSKAAAAAFATASAAIASSVAAIGVAATAGFGYAVKSAADFEQSMSNVKSVMSPDEIKEFSTSLEELALKMGADTKYTAIEAAKGIEELLKAGINTEEILNGGLRGALSLATAGEIELAEAAEIASTALNAFKKDGLSVQNAADILAGAANASATSVGELKFGLSQVAGAAVLAGQNFEDTTTALAVLAQQGLKGSDAGTSLKTMLLNLQPATKSATEAFMELGFMTKDGTNAFLNADDSFKSLTEIAGILQEKLKGLSEAQRTQALETMFGSDAIRAAGFLYEAGAEGMDKMAESMSKVGADQVAEERMNNFNSAVDNLKGSITDSAIAFGKVFLPGLTETTKGMDEFISKMVESGQVKAFSETVKSVFDEVKEGAQVFFNLVRPLFDEYKEKFIDSGLAALMFKQYVLPTLQEVWTAIQKFVQVIGLLWNEWGDELIAVATVAFSTIWNVLKNAFQVINGILDTFIGLFTGDWKKFDDGIRQIWTGLWSAVGNILSGAWGILKPIFGGLLESIGSWFKGLIDQGPQWARDFVDGFVNGFRNTISKAVQVAEEMASAVAGAVKSFLKIQSPSKLMAEYGKYVAEGFAEGIDENKEIVAEKAEKMAELTKEKTAKAKEGILDQIRDLNKKLKPEAEIMAEAIAEAVNQSMNDINLGLEISKAEFELWSTQIKDDAVSAVEKFKAEMELLEIQLQTSKDKVELLDTAYKDMAKQKGINAEETMKLYLELLKEQKVYEEIAQSIAKAKKEAQEYNSIKITRNANGGGTVWQTYTNSSGQTVTVGTGFKSQLDRGEDDDDHLYTDGWDPDDHTDTHVGGFKDMPRYGVGTDNHPGGLAIVGENGPEIANLPRGTSVTPNHELDKMLSIDYDRLGRVIGEQLNQVLSKFGNTTPVAVNVYGNTFKDGHDLGDKLNDTLRRLGI